MAGSRGSNSVITSLPVCVSVHLSASVSLPCASYHIGFILQQSFFLLEGAPGLHYPYKEKSSGRGNLSSGYKHKISGTSSDWMGFGYVPIPEPITEATVRIH